MFTAGLILSHLITSVFTIIIVAIVIDYMGVFGNMPKPFSCSQCMSFWVSIIYSALFCVLDGIVVTQLDILLCILISVVFSIFAPVLGRLIMYSMDYLKCWIDYIFIK